MPNWLIAAFRMFLVQTVKEEALEVGMGWRRGGMEVMRVLLRSNLEGTSVRQKGGKHVGLPMLS